MAQSHFNKLKNENAQMRTLLLRFVKVCEHSAQIKELSNGHLSLALNPIYLKALQFIGKESHESSRRRSANSPGILQRK
jgi:hypothetical protein